MDGTVSCMTRRMPCKDRQDDDRQRAPHIETELSTQCKYGVIHSQMHRFSRRLRRAPLFCKATGQLLANLIQHGYDRARLWDKVKRFSAPYVPRHPQAQATMKANDGGCSIRSDIGRSISCCRTGEVAWSANDPLQAQPKLITTV